MSSKPSLTTAWIGVIMIFMAVGLPKTDVYLVRNLSAAFEVANELGAKAVGLDLEGVIGNYVGNDPYPGSFDDFMCRQGQANISRVQLAIRERPDVVHGIVTNNTNSEPFKDYMVGGLVVRVACILEIPFVHKGMRVGDVALRGKPSGELSRHFCEIVGVSTQDTVLIDDQGVKNAGEAVRAGLKAMIVPPAIGLPDGTGGIKEHKWVQRGRKYEPQIYTSLGSHGLLARLAYRCIAHIDPRQIGQLHDWRDI